MSLRALVVDDEELARRRVRELVTAHDALEFAGEASNGAAALDLLVDLRPDVLFLDIEMPELDGFEVLQALEEDALPLVVFVTAYDRYAIDAFEVGAVDYLLKPITDERFRAAVERVQRRIAHEAPPQQLRAVAERLEHARGYARRFVARRGGRHYFVPVDELTWIEADGNYLRLHTSDGSHLVRRTLKEAEARLDPQQFVRIHRSLLVAIDRIRTIESGDSGEYVVTMQDGTRLQASRSYNARVRALLR